MKKVIFIGIAFLMGGQILAQNDSISSDTSKVDTEVRFGNIKIIIDGDDKGITYNPDEERTFPNVDFIPSFDIGVAGYTKDYTGVINYVNSPDPRDISTASGDLDFGKSRNIGINGNLVFNITKNFGIVTGLGLNYNTYRFSENLVVTPKTGAFMEDSITSYSKYKFRNRYVQLPLMLKLQTSNEDFQIAFGGTVGYNFGSKVKAEYTIDGGEYKTVVKDNYNVEPLKLSVGARFNYKGLGLYFNYGLNEVLSGVDKNYNGYNLMPFEAGITLGTF